MYKKLLFFFYSLCIDINNIIGINIFLFPFYLYKNTTKYTIALFWIIAFLFITLFITGHRIKKNLILDTQKNTSWLYFLSDYFYYISLLCIINTNMFYINKIINLYNNISFFYTSIGIIILLFLFILIKNNTTAIDNILILIKLIILIPAIYFLYRIPYNIQNLTPDFNIRNVFESIPILFFSFLGNDYIFHTEEDTEKITTNNKINYIKIGITFLIISTIYSLLSPKIVQILTGNVFTLNTTLSEILLKNYTNNTIIHFLNIFIILVCFFTIYSIILKCQQLIEKTIRKTSPDHSIAEIIILFFILFSILIISKMIIIQQKNIILSVFFSTLSFLCYLINSFNLSFFNIHTLYVLASICFIITINIISIHQLILIM